MSAPTKSTYKVSTGGRSGRDDRGDGGDGGSRSRNGSGTRASSTTRPVTFTKAPISNHQDRKGGQDALPQSQKGTDEATAPTSNTLTKGRVIVFIDIPDPDNFLLVLRTIRDNPGEVDVVVTPRPVDFSAEPLGAYDATMMFKGTKQQAMYVMHATPKDKGFEDTNICHDTEIYTKVSIFRLRSYLRTHGVKDEDYSVFRRDKMSGYGQTGLQPVMRHSFHAPDFTWGNVELKTIYEQWPTRKFECKYSDKKLTTDEQKEKDEHSSLYDEHCKLVAEFEEHGDKKNNILAERKKRLDTPDPKTFRKEDPTYQTDLEKWNSEDRVLRKKVDDWIQKAKPKLNARDETLRKTARDLCETYNKTKSKEYPAKPESLQKLVEKYTKPESPTQLPLTHMYVGGPFTDVNFIIEKLKDAGKLENVKIFAQGGATVKGHKHNLMPNQFNFHCDMEAANKFLGQATGGEIDVTLVPTELAKIPAFVFKKQGIISLFKEDACTEELYLSFLGSKPDVPIFDLFVALAAMDEFPEILKTKGLKLRKAQSKMISQRDAKGTEYSSQFKVYQEALDSSMKIDLLRLELDNNPGENNKLKVWWVDGLTEQDTLCAKRFDDKNPLPEGFYATELKSEEAKLRTWFIREIRETCDKVNT